MLPTVPHANALACIIAVKETDVWVVYESTFIEILRKKEEKEVRLDGSTFTERIISPKVREFQGVPEESGCLAVVPLRGKVLVPSRDYVPLPPPLTDTYTTSTTTTTTNTIPITTTTPLPSTMTLNDIPPPPPLTDTYTTPTTTPTTTTTSTSVATTSPTSTMSTTSSTTTSTTPATTPTIIDIPPTPQQQTLLQRTLEALSWYCGCCRPHYSQDEDKKEENSPLIPKRR